MEPIINKYTAIKVTFIIGAPGSGKGTLCKTLAAKQKAYHLSVGDYLRELSTSNTPESILTFTGLKTSELQNYLSKYQLVPTADIVEILWTKIGKKIDKGFTRFLLDGFPRDEASGYQWEQKMDHNSCTEPKIIFFDCLKEIAKERFLSRKRESTDSEEVFEKRYREFEVNNKEVVQRYRRGIVVVDSSGATEKTERNLFGALGIEK